MSSACLAQAEQHQQLEWLGGGTMSILLDSEATDGQLMVARLDASEGARLRATCTPARTRCSW